MFVGRACYDWACMLRLFIRSMVVWCREDLNYFTTAKIDGHSDPEVKNRLQHVAQSGFKRISYTEAIDILSKAIQEFKPQKKDEKLFEFPVSLTALDAVMCCLHELMLLMLVISLEQQKHGTCCECRLSGVLTCPANMKDTWRSGFSSRQSLYTTTPRTSRYVA